MSRAGTKSNQGDDYQLKIAMHWLLRLLSDDDIDYIQAESNGLPNIDEKVSVDDVVIVYKDGHRRHIQAKKNQTNQDRDNQIFQGTKDKCDFFKGSQENPWPSHI